MIRVVCAMIVCMFCVQPFSLGQKIQPFMELTGQYKVGVTQFQWTDTNREETFTKFPNDKRVVTAQIWYPVDPSAKGNSAPYLLNENEFLGNAEDAKRLVFINSVVTTRSMLNVTVSNQQKKYPVLIYNPGGANTRFLSSFLTEQLASQGFIVVGIEHVGDSMATHFADGKPIELDNPPLTENANFDSAMATEQEYFDEVQRQWGQRDHILMPVVIADNLFVLKKLEELNRIDGILQNRLDMQQVGVLGWSFGGAQAIELLVAHNYIKAGVDLDGQLFGPNKASLRTHKPFMLFHNTQEEELPGALGKAMSRLISLVENWNAHLISHSTGLRYRVYISGTDHGSFSDWNIFFSVASKDEKRIAEVRRHERIITELTTAFFKKHLLHEETIIPIYETSVVKMEFWEK